ncbi:ferric reductase-like transmembrane domain-containing protein [Ovoidimarina sediminis]|uniref:ferric reductase-like transmembrane domain-containing protein n=1 Tax=Ovoidimarina sediminis TaxID=3079856 RepID=UPI0029107F7D|nr:ferric reductase-like transmembrane domain-containing protein [Rhodophyticola sp. MJ-SS7]MDU8946636.1 ferric reductase-like transmembrane domain-containing protein [Rhodophyticola sp. MJ-SS7]
MPAARALLIWAALGAATIGPLAVAANSPFLEWRAPVYILAGFAGVAAMALILVQPLLAGGYLPGLPRPLGRRVHRWTGGLLIACVLLHVAGLWLTSPPDVIDALLFTSPTPFSAWGVIAMWALFAAGMLALLRRPLHLRPRLWRLGHSVLVVVVALGSVVHALLIEGTMGMVSKTLLCILVLAALAKVLHDLRAWTLFRR